MSPRLSPDPNGQRVVVENLSRQDYDVRIQVYDTQYEQLRPLATEGDNQSPQWSPDGKKIAFRSRRPEGSGIFWRAADMSAPAELLVSDTPSGAKLYPHSWAREGDLWACTAQGDIWTLNMDGGHEPLSFLDTRYDECNPAFSPDGRWLAYASSESGQYEVYLREYPDGGQLKQVSSGGGANPVWSRDGQELFYCNDKDMMVVKITREPRLSMGKPEKLFTSSCFTGDNLHTHYDISPDGDRFLMIKRKDNLNVQLICVLNWFEEL